LPVIWENFHKEYCKQAEVNLYYRINQSAAHFLQYGCSYLIKPELATQLADKPYSITADELFNFSVVESILHPFVHVSETNNTYYSQTHLASLEALAEIYFMKGNYEKFLEFHLVIGARFPQIPLSVLEDIGINWINEVEIQNIEMFQLFEK